MSAEQEVNMQIQVVKDPDRPTGRNWAAVDVEHYAYGAGTLQGHPMVELPIRRDGTCETVFFLPLRKDVEAALQLLTHEQKE